MSSRRSSRALVARIGSIGLVIGLGIGMVASLVFAGAAEAKVFASQKQALAEAFPDATRIARETHVLRKAQVERITAITRDGKTMSFSATGISMCTTFGRSRKLS
jgi:hypothetical protein